MITALVPLSDPLNGRTAKPPPPTLTTDAVLYAIADESPCNGGMLDGELGFVVPEMLIAPI